jgi:hypothetical protein
LSFLVPDRGLCLLHGFLLAWGEGQVKSDCINV